MATMSTSTISPRRAAADATSRHVGVIAARELAIAFAVFLAYRAGRLITNDSVEVAQRNAERVLGWQAAVHADVERWVQDVALDVPGLIDALNHYYVYVHFPSTVVFLVWVFVRHRDRYAAVRNWFVGVTMAAMVIHVVFPLAPPRMRSGFVDTLAVFGPTIYPEDTSRSVANQFAAMPSLHFGWALMIGIALVMLTGPRRRRLHWLWLLHPAITLLAIVATANHYVLDAAVAAGLAIGIGYAVLALERRSRPAPDPTPAVTPPAPAPVPAPVRCARTGRGSDLRERRDPAPLPHEVHHRSPARETAHTRGSS